MLTKNALPLAKVIAKLWSRIYTLPNPPTLRQNLRADDDAYVDDFVGDYLDEGYHPVIVAALLMFDTARGMPADIEEFGTWAYESLPSKLHEWSETIGDPEARTAIAATIGALGVINLFAIASETGDRWTQLLVANTGALMGFDVLRIQRYRCARWFANLAMTCFFVIVISFAAWAIVKFRLFEIPELREAAFQIVFAFLPFMLMILVNSNVWRRFVFRDRRWPVFACWLLIATVFLTISIAVGGSLSQMPWIWSGLVIGFAVLVGICVIFVIIALLLWIVVSNLIATGMRRVATLIGNQG